MDTATSALGVATIAAIGSIITPIITSMIRTREQKINWARQEVVAKQTVAVAVQAAEAARLLVDSNKVIAAQGEQTQRQLVQIHTLVNSNLMKEMERTLVALDGQKLLMEEVFRLNAKSGLEPNAEAMIALRNLRQEAEALRSALVERVKATDQAAADRGAE